MLLILKPYNTVENGRLRFALLTLCTVFCFYADLVFVHVGAHNLIMLSIDVWELHKSMVTNCGEYNILYININFLKGLKATIFVYRNVVVRITCAVELDIFRKKNTIRITVIISHFIFFLCENKCQYLVGFLISVWLCITQSKVN